jgi:hypothetical protein
VLTCDLPVAVSRLVDSLGIDQASISADCREGLLVLYYSKSLMIPPAYLRDAEIPVYEVTLSAGQVLVARGDWIHCGLNLSPYSIGAAVNFEDETGMCENPLVVLDLCTFVAKHHPKVNPAAQQWVEEWRRVNPAGAPPFYESSAIWDLVLLNVPYYWTCSRLRGQKIDMWKKREGRDLLTVEWSEEVRLRKLLYIAMQEEDEPDLSEEEKQANYETEADIFDFRYLHHFPYTRSDEQLEDAELLIEGQFSATCCARPCVRPDGAHARCSLSVRAQVPKRPCILRECAPCGLRPAAIPAMCATTT